MIVRTYEAVCANLSLRRLTGRRKWIVRIGAPASQGHRDKGSRRLGRFARISQTLHSHYRFAQVRKAFCEVPPSIVKEPSMPQERAASVVTLRQAQTTLTANASPS